MQLSNDISDVVLGRVLFNTVVKGAGKCINDVNALLGCKGTTHRKSVKQ
jgi:hypothetical protein